MKFPRRNGGSVAVFQATKGVRCACEQSRGSAIENVFCAIMSLREATVFVAPWQSPERVLLVYDNLSQWPYLNWLYKVVPCPFTLWNTPTAPLPRPPAPHGQGHISGTGGRWWFCCDSIMLLEYVQRNMPGGKWDLAMQDEIRLRRMKSHCVR